jgi:hypothetical protein
MIIYSEQKGGVLTEEERGVLDLYIRLFETDTSPLIFRWLSTKSKRRLAELKNDGDINTYEYSVYMDEVTSILSTSPKEKNYIGRVNIVTLQLIILFMQFLPPQTSKNELETQHRKLSKKINYLDYESTKQYVIHYKPGINESDDQLPLLWNSTQGIFLIVGVDHLSMDTMLNMMMKNIFFAGLSFKQIMADGVYDTPLGFCIHDLDHGKGVYLDHVVYSTTKTMVYIDIREHLSSFYSFIKSKKGRDYDNTKFYRIKLIFYLLVHESSFVSFFYKKRKFLVQETVVLEICDVEDVIRDLTEDSIYKRFMNIHDLGNMLPSNYKESGVDHNLEKITEYINGAAGMYVSALSDWKKGKGGTRRKYKRKTRRR